MKLELGDMWTAWGASDLWLFTANSTVMTSGHLVMGSGIAAQVLARYPGCNYGIGQAVKQAGPMFGLLVSPQWPSRKLGLFQTKTDWRHRSKLDIIERSTALLIAWCIKYPTARVDLNYPGIGQGKLTVEQVQPIVTHLPDTVNVWLDREELYEQAQSLGKKLRAPA